MASIYLFDVDGTLTAAKTKMDPSFKGEFHRWMKDKEVYVVSGGSFTRILNQIGSEIVYSSEGIFACMGNIFYREIENINATGFSEWEIVYENKFKAPRGLYKRLDQIVKQSDFHTKTGKHHEARPGMVNFSIVGGNATLKEREAYASYDAHHGERERLVEELKKEYTQLDFVVGGAVSIDIFKIGDDKSQIVDRYFNDAIEHNNIIFVGDRIPFPGNDCSLATALRQHPNGSAHEVERWQDTAELLKTPPFA